VVFGKPADEAAVGRGSVDAIKASIAGHSRKVNIFLQFSDLRNVRRLDRTRFGLQAAAGYRQPASALPLASDAGNREVSRRTRR
jgi:hypothetical protein